jgi:hypothetical protein
MALFTIITVLARLKGQNGQDLALASDILKSVSQRGSGTFMMAIHKQILEWQAAHPNITWIGWGIVWASWSRSLSGL